MRCVTVRDRNARPIVAVNIVNNETGEKTAIYALEDGGADRDFLSAKVVEKLGIRTEEELSTVIDLSIAVGEELVAGLHT